MSSDHPHPALSPAKPQPIELLLVVPGLRLPLEPGLWEPHGALLPLFLQLLEGTGALWHVRDRPQSSHAVFATVL